MKLPRIALILAALTTTPAVAAHHKTSAAPTMTVSSANQADLAIRLTEGWILGTSPTARPQ
jgi:hypothetical protein